MTKRPIPQPTRLAARLEGASTAVLPVVMRKGETELTVELPPTIVSPNNFAADCAVALVQHDSPVFRFVQLHPLRTNMAAKVLHVRYGWEAFRRQLETSTAFRDRLEALSDAMPRRTVAAGYFTQLAKDTVADASTQSLTLDADFDYVAHNGSRCSILYLSVDPRETAAAVQGKVEQVRLNAQVAVTLSVGALVDLIRSWEGLVEVEL